MMEEDMEEMEILEPQHSPIIPINQKSILTRVEMSFPAAIKQIVAGRKIHKLEWEDKEYYGFLNNGILSIHKPDGKNYQWILNDGDLTGTDWIVI